MDEEVNREALEKLKSERARAESEKWEEVGQRKKALLIRTTAIGVGMCFLVGLFMGANLLILAIGSILLAGGATAAAVRFGLGSYSGGILLGAVSTGVIFLAGGGSLMVPLFCIPLGMAIFLGFRGEASM